MKRIFTGSGEVKKYFKLLLEYRIEIRSTAHIIMATNKEEAMGKLMFYLKDNFPLTEGWYDHTGQVKEVQLEWIKEVANEITDSK